MSGTKKLDIENYRKFYDTLEFKDEVFNKFIKMIPDNDDKEYYLSAMNNGSLHKYFHFINKRKAAGFLNNGSFFYPYNYLSLKKFIKSITASVILTDEEKELRKQCLKKMEEDNEFKELRIKIIDLLIKAYNKTLLKILVRSELIKI